MKHHVAQPLQANRLAVHLDLGAVGIDPRTKLGHYPAVDRHPARLNQFFAGAPRPDPRTCEQLLQSLFSHFTDPGTPPTDCGQGPCQTDSGVLETASVPNIHRISPTGAVPVTTAPG